MPQVALRPVSPEDERFLLEVFIVSHPEYQQLPVTDEQKLHIIQMQHQLQSADYRSRYPDSTHDVIEVDGQAAGRIWIDRNELHINVLDIGLMPWTRHQGIGTSVIDRVKAEARAAGKPIVSVVQRVNSGSLRWQIRMGFHITREDEFHHFMEWRPEPDAG
jgi:ribosomal protein S18 acetylase RimI-like enzyme